ncbi:MAG TPA: nuclear transport factor 2 family protein [Gaiellaceae bacterium]|nr:nuclear transport factor 2 family protein [Gaiellaceae bacterium]
MAGEPEGVVRQMFEALDRMDISRMQQVIAEDAQSVDEISRRWLRSKGELGDYLKQLGGAVSDVRTELRDVHEQAWGDAGVVTCWLEQDYTMEGAGQHVSAPTTVVLRREKGEWRITLFHSVPLPEGLPG